MAGDPVNLRDSSGTDYCYQESFHDGYTISYIDGDGILTTEVHANHYITRCVQTGRGTAGGVSVHGGGGGGATGTSPSPQNNIQVSSPSPCNGLQRGAQQLGRFAVGVGTHVSYAGAGLVVVGTGVAEVSALFLQPEGVLAGGALAVDGGVLSSVGNLITIGGASLVALGGSGKPGAVQLGKDAISAPIPNGVVKNGVRAAAGFLLNAIIPEIRSCRP